MAMSNQRHPFEANRARSLVVTSLLWMLLCSTAPISTGALLFGARRRAVLPTSILSNGDQHRLVSPPEVRSSLFGPSSTEAFSRIHASSLSSSDAAASASSPSDTDLQAPNGAGALVRQGRTLSAWQSRLTRLGMMAYIASLCVLLPLTLLPQRLVYMAGLMTKQQKEHYAVATSAFCCRWMLRLIPFCRLTFYPYHHPNPVESVWVCNHSSLLDVFILLASDRQMRGTTRRPIKIVYWKELEKNPICNIMFKQAGFIPVQMAANKAGEDNDYDKSSFKKLLKDSKQAFADGFDIGILPEGQLNPTPEKGLLPVFSGAFTLARMSRRPIQMMALHGVHDLWHPVHGMHCVSRHIKARAYPYMFRFANSKDFVETFKTIIGHFALHGQDLSEDEQNKVLSKVLLSSNNK